jgi:hypothetical protein
MHAGVMAYLQSLPVGLAWDVVDDIMEKLDNEDETIMILSLPLPSPPPLRRQRAVRFVPASTVIGSLGSRTNPISIE